LESDGNYWSPYWGGTAGSGSCTRTVQYNGRCYNACDVNYIQWGYMNKLCSKDVSRIKYNILIAQATIEVWKFKKYVIPKADYIGALTMIMRAKLFSLHGYFGTSPFPASRKCNIENTIPKSYIMDFTWHPLKNREIFE